MRTQREQTETPPTQTDSDLLTPRDVAARLGVTVGTLVDWRFKRVGPAYTKIGKLVRYPSDALAAWIAARTVKTVADTGTANRGAA